VLTQLLLCMHGVLPSLSEVLYWYNGMHVLSQCFESLGETVIKVPLLDNMLMLA
jgi:hypothetical protein